MLFVVWQADTRVKQRVGPQWLVLETSSAVDNPGMWVRSPLAPGSPVTLKSVEADAMLHGSFPMRN